MSSNSVEEGLMLQIGNPSHLDRGRIAVPAGAIAGGVLAFLMTGPLWLRLLVGMSVGVAIFVTSYRYFGRRALEREASRQQSARADRVKAVESQLSAAQNSSRTG